jgi:hypothetical protein
MKVGDYMARVIPHYHGMAVPQETARIRWQPRQFEATDVS